MNIELAIINVCLLCILTVPHEFAHAWMASKLGDDTPEREGRLTLYPPAHIDPIGTVLLPAITSLFGGGLLGWGRPVNTTPSRLRYGLNGMALVAMAGPASNVIMTALFAAVSVFTASLFTPLSEVAERAASLSMYLAVFNMLPVPPLDGSKLLIAARFPLAIYEELGRFGFLLLMVLLTATPLGVWLYRLSIGSTDAIFRIFQ